VVMARQALWWPGWRKASATKLRAFGAESAWGFQINRSSPIQTGAFWTKPEIRTSGKSAAREVTVSAESNACSLLRGLERAAVMPRVGSSQKAVKP